jgi:CDP-diacylglycerol--glycerol-3-phosphate 3-phosphatidyltransferase
MTLALLLNAGGSRSEGGEGSAPTEAALKSHLLPLPYASSDKLIERRRREIVSVERAEKREVYETFTDWARATAQVITVPIAKFLGGLGIHPNVLTLVGALLCVGIGALLATGHLSLGGWLLLVVAPIDALDGALARTTGKRSAFGAFFDSTMDRFSESALLLGLGIHYLQLGAGREMLLSSGALVAAILVSYTRARAEANGFSCKVGLFTRLERTVVLAVGLAVGLATPALWILAVGATLTVLHRVLHVYAAYQREEEKYG